MWNASPIACVPAAQAVPTQNVGPFRPRSIDIWLAPALVIKRGIVNGCRRGEFSP